ncbi:LacI family DNA-binding transcriptional regulator [soil metagenome]
MPELIGSAPPRSAEPASLRAVADLAGVSIATVSRVMSGSDHPVAVGTRQRVLEAANTLSFEPNRLARALVTARSQTVGVIVHDISDSYFGEIVKGFEDGIHADGYRLFMASSERDPDKELEYVRAFAAYQVDAIVFAASGLTSPDYQRALEDVIGRFRGRGGVTITLSDHSLDGARVRFDNARAMAAMVDYLASRGHRNIGFIGGPPGLMVTQARLSGYVSAMERLGLGVTPGLIADGHFTIKGGSEAAAEICRHGDPTAILASNDLMAIGATRHLLSTGTSVPGEISVAGFDDTPIAEFGPVPLTTMRVPTYGLGQRGADLLLGILAGLEPEDEWLEGEIIERSSVATLAE